MTYTVDTTAGVIVSQVDGRESRVPLYSKEGFELLSRLWLARTKRTGSGRIS